MAQAGETYENFPPASNRSSSMQALWNALTRRKRTDDSSNGDTSETKLARVLNLFDLTALGVGSTLGLGVYVLAGAVAYENAGPAVTLSFLVAAIASAFAGLCYAEFAARVPKAGSAYVYSYVTVGELVAFTIGWNLILEYVIGTSSVARGLSGYIDALMDKQMETYLRENMPISVSFLGDYPDFLSFFMVLLLAAVLSFGVKESSFLNNVFTVINLATILVVIVSGAINADTYNWNIPKEDIPPGVNGGEGGFMPFGIAGVMAGAAKCFFGFVGFDCVATTGEEAINPQRNIPLSIVLSLIIIFLSYFGISTVLTLMWPYYLQDPVAPFPHVFDEIGWIEIKWLVTIGAIFALCTCLLGGMFPLPRVLYAMSSDGVLYKQLSQIDARTKTPLIATACAGLLAGTMALLFDLSQLIDMMSIGTLLAYTIVSVSVLLLRYDCDALAQRLQVRAGEASVQEVLRQLLNVNGLKTPTRLSAILVKCSILLYICCAILLCVIANRIQFHTFDGFVQAALVCTLAATLAIIIVIGRQPMADAAVTFRVPLVPWIPCLSVLINLYLMFQLDAQTWMRFAIWGAIGYFIYFTYGIQHSREGAMLAKEREANASMVKTIETTPPNLALEGTYTQTVTLKLTRPE